MRLHGHPPPAMCPHPLPLDPQCQAVLSPAHSQYITENQYFGAFIDGVSAAVIGIIAETVCQLIKAGVHTGARRPRRSLPPPPFPADGEAAQQPAKQRRQQLAAAQSGISWRGSGG